MIKRYLVCTLILILSDFVSPADGTFEQLQTAVNKGQILKGIRYNLGGKTLILGNHQKLIGQKNTIIFSDYYPNFHWQFIKIRPNLKPIPTYEMEILKTHPHLIVLFKSSVLSQFVIDDKVVLEGTYIDGTPQSLFSKISAISNDGKTVTLQDSLPFTIGPPLSLIKLVDVNCHLSGLSIEINSDQQQSLIDVDDYCDNVTISNCSFTAIKGANKNIGIFIRHSTANVLNCSLNGFGLYAIRYENTGYGSIQGCIIQNSFYAITLFRLHNFIVNGNTIKKGKNLAHGRSIFISADDDNNHFSGDECCCNKITNNVIDNAVLGVAGSCLGGVHLHRKCKYNIISGNISMHNGMGIYLETNNDFNHIVNNRCSYNNQDSTPGNIYGIGIELDYENDGNIIDHNECNYNNGLVKDPLQGNNWYGMTGMGIEIRNGRGGHDNKNNIITNNICSYNGSIGITIRGTGSRASDNILVDNGQNIQYSLRNGAVLSGNDIIFNNNLISGESVCKVAPPYLYRSLDVYGNDIKIDSNHITSGLFVDNDIYVFDSSKNIIIDNNTINEK